jgi:hypothetical protein
VYAGRGSGRRGVLRRGRGQKLGELEPQRLTCALFVYHSMVRQYDRHYVLYKASAMVGVSRGSTQHNAGGVKHEQTHRKDL